MYRLQQYFKLSIVYILLTLAGLMFLAPFIWMITTSLKVPSQLFVYPPVWIPKPIAWENYFNAVTSINFFIYLKNTIIVAGVSTLGVIISCPVAAYSLARIQWKGRDTLFLITLAVMMIPGAGNNGVIIYYFF